MNNPVPDDDSKMVASCIDGDLAAWENLVAKYSPLMYTSISGRIRKYGMSLPGEDIEDIFQNVLTSIWNGRKLAEIKNRSDISFWLAVVSGNAAVEYLRGMKSAGIDITVPLSDTPDEETGTSGGGPVDRPVPSVSTDPTEDDISDEIQKALGRLSDKERLIMKLLIFHDKKYVEIARILNMPRGTVACCIKRARAKLKRILK